jgi:hypothetical protein
MTVEPRLLPSGVLAEILRRTDGAFDVVFWTNEHRDAAYIHHALTLADARALVADAGGAR